MLPLTIDNLKLAFRDRGLNGVSVILSGKSLDELRDLRKLVDKDLQDLAENASRKHRKFMNHSMPDMTVLARIRELINTLIADILRE